MNVSPTLCLINSALILIVIFVKILCKSTNYLRYKHMTLWQLVQDVMTGDKMSCITLYISIVCHFVRVIKNENVTKT